MLRRRPDNTFEFRDIERALYSIQPPALTVERKDALRSRIMASLGEQEALRQSGILTPAFRERWVAVPAGMGIAAAIIGGIYAYRSYDGEGNGAADVTFAGQLSVDGVPAGELRPGTTFIAVSYTHVSLGHEVVVLLEQGASFSYAESDGDLTFYPGNGKATVVTGDSPADVVGKGWSARLGADSAAEFSVASYAVTIESDQGIVSVTDPDGAVHGLAAGGSLTFRLGDPPHPEITPPADPFGGNGASQPPTGNGPFVGDPGDSEGTGTPAPPTPAASEKQPTETPKAGGQQPETPPASNPAGDGDEPAADPPANPPVIDPPAGPPSDPGTPPVEPEAPPETPGSPITPPGQGGESPADPPADPGPSENPGSKPDEPPAGAPEEPGSQGNGNGPTGENNGNGPGGNGNGNGNAFGPGANGSDNGNGSEPLVTAASSDSADVVAVDSGHGTSAQGGGAGGGNAFGLTGTGHERGNGNGSVERSAAAGDAGSSGAENGNGSGPENANARAESPQNSSAGNGAGSNNGNAENNPGKGKGPA